MLSNYVIPVMQCGMFQNLIEPLGQYCTIKYNRKYINGTHSARSEASFYAVPLSIG